MASFREEFPDFDPATLPAIPGGFEDASWHNDACPAFICAAADLCIWVDYADPALREMESTAPRFRLEQLKDGQHADGKTLCESDDWQEVIAAAVGEVHAATLAQWLPHAQWEEMRARNAADPAAARGDACHSHDFCDANMATLAAFQIVFGRDPHWPCDVGEGDGAPTQEACDADLAVMNAALAYAAQHHLTAK